MDKVFNFKPMPDALLFIDGNYLIQLSRSLSIKLDMEKFFDNICDGFYRKRTYWYSALDGGAERSNNTFRFLDRLRYIPRTKVYAGRLSKKPSPSIHYVSALQTDAGISFATTLVEKAIHKEAQYFILVTNDPEYAPAVRMVQRYGGIVILVVPQYIGDTRVHSELQKVSDELIEIDPPYLEQFEYDPILDYDDSKISEDPLSDDEIILEDGEANEDEDEMVEDIEEEVEVIPEEDESDEK